MSVLFRAIGRPLVYRGRRVVPHRRRRLGWLATVHRWDVEHHEVEIELDGNGFATSRRRCTGAA
jgi:hypothetical protein